MQVLGGMGTFTCRLGGVRQGVPPGWAGYRHALQCAGVGEGGGNLGVERLNITSLGSVQLFKDYHCQRVRVKARMKRCRSGGSREQGGPETNVGDEDHRRFRACRRSYRGVGVHRLRSLAISPRSASSRAWAEKGAQAGFSALMLSAQSMRSEMAPMRIGASASARRAGEGVLKAASSSGSLASW